MNVTPEAMKRIREVTLHIMRMRAERQTRGDRDMRGFAETCESWVLALEVLFEADEVYIDTASPFSFGGRLPGGIVFGMIGRVRPATEGGHEYAIPPVEWTFHS